MVESPAPHPGSAEKLHEYWVHGPGAAKIRWGTPGDFDRCTRQLEEHAHFTPEQAHGYCNLAHHSALGIYPATHAKLEHGGKRSTPMAETSRAQMAASSINDLPDSAFAYIEPGGKKDSSGRTEPRSLRHFPIHDAAHVRNALSRAPQSPFGEKAMPAIRKAAKKFGVDVADDSQRSGDLPVREFARTWDLADVTVRQDGGGRIVQAYVTPFDRATEIRDQDGHYEETIGRGAFTKTLAERGLNFAVLYNHGRTFDGRTDGALMMPIGVPRLLEQHDRGLYSEVEYLENPLADAALDAIKKKALQGYSFTGRFMKSARTRGSRSTLPIITRSEVAMREFGPVLFPAYEAAQIVGTRMLDILAHMDPEDLDGVRQFLGITTPREPVTAATTPSGAGYDADPAQVRQSTPLSRRIRAARIARGME